MKTTRLAATLLLLAPIVSAEDFIFRPLPSVPGVLESMDSLKVLQAPGSKESRRAAPRMAFDTQVRLNVYQYSDGSFTVYEPFLRVDLRANKTWRDDFDFNLYGRVGDANFNGDARAKFMRDPALGYNLSGTGFNAYLDKFGDSYILNGSYDFTDASGATRRESFNYRIERDFPTSYTWRIWDFGIDLRVDTTPYSADMWGSYDKTRVGPGAIALLGTAVGLINQPKIRQTPGRP